MGKNNVTFPNCMVDRITPAITDADKERLNRENKVDDAAPIFTEDFMQWVIEDKFITGRPAWDKVGVQFTDDVTVYVNMKISLLNASHLVLSYPAFYAGYRKVDEAMGDTRLVRLIHDFMEKDMTPYVPEPTGIDLKLYKHTLMERFGNKVIGDQLSRICMDGSSRFSAHIMPNLKKWCTIKPI